MYLGGSKVNSLTTKAQRHQEKHLIQKSLFLSLLCAFARQSLQVGKAAQRAALPLREIKKYQCHE
ncbi:hypothetical protein JYQ62_36285 [Nostoc sp. UHCC 0702]|nr:hypothetical protein JYQ62_36285 [Nostoc sp. UHCC 0702]